MKQKYKMIFPNNLKCNNDILLIADYKCCTFQTRINSYVNTFCTFLQWNLKYSNNEKDRLKRFFDTEELKLIVREMIYMFLLLLYFLELFSYKSKLK